MPPSGFLQEGDIHLIQTSIPVYFFGLTIHQELSVPYRLFHTKNIWTFIQLETATGRLWQIQYDIQDNNRGGVVINAEDLSKSSKIIHGRFTLYPTENIYNFIMLDQIDGRIWQVQWSFEEENRFIIPIID